MDTTGPGHFRYHSSNCMVYNDSRAINESTIPVLDLICLLLVLLDFHGLSRPEVRHFFRHLHITLQHYYPRIPCITSDLPNHHQVNRPGIPSLPFPESYVVRILFPEILDPTWSMRPARNLGNKSPRCSVACVCPIPGLLIAFVRNR